MNKSQYRIKRVETNKDGLKQPECCEKGILPKLVSSYLIVGKSGSGKTILLANLLASKDLLGGVFDFIFVFSPVKSDDILKNILNLPKENYFNDFTEDDVNKIIDAMSSKIEEKGMEFVQKNFKVAMIFDDILSRPKFLKSKAIRKLVTAARHFCISTFFLTQYYKKIPPVIRTNCNATMFFPSSMQEIEKLSEEHCQPGQTKKQFIRIVERATDEKHSFLTINYKAEPGKRLRKNLTTILYDDETEEEII